MAQMRENGDRSALGGTLLFILGLLIAIVVVVNAAAWGLGRAGERFAG